MTGPHIRVLLVDDHPTVLLGLAYGLAAHADIEVAAAERDAQRGMDSFLRLEPDVVLLDLSMPGDGGLQLMRRMLDHDPQASVLVLTSSSDEETVAEVMDAGASGYLLKDREFAEVVAAVRAAAQGEVPIDPRLTRSLFRPAAVVVVDGVAPELTPRECDVLRLVRLGLTNKQIAVRLGIGQTTVKTHLSSAFRRIGVADRTSAAVWVNRHLEKAGEASTTGRSNVSTTSAGAPRKA
jgi:DNA-binding NarL/FixJ family response regulator